MTRLNYTSVRQTALCVATAVAISIPDTVSTDDISLVIKELNLKKQLQNSYIIMQHVKSDELQSSGGSNYGVECVNYRTELKGVISDFLSIICIVPALSTDNTLIDNLESALTLVDYIPARTLYLMWKTLGGQLERIRTAVNNFGQDLAVIPPLEDFTVFNESTYTYEMNGTWNSGGQINESIRNNGIFTQSLFNRSFVDLFQARLEMYACRLNSFANLTPDTKTNGEDADTSYACFALNSSDQVKLPLELMAMTH